MFKKANLCLALIGCAVLVLTGLAQAFVVSTSGGGIVLDSGGFEAEVQCKY